MNLQCKFYHFKISVLLYIIIIASINILPQTYSVSGQIADSSSKKPLGKANVIFTHLPDLKINGIIVDINGRFRIENLTRGKYILTVSFLGYKSYKKNIEIDRVIELPKIYLISEGVEMKEVDIIGKTSGVTIKNDTTEYSADAYKVNKDAVAEDLVEKMPGITVQQDGTVQAHGETVTNVLVDGKMFFGSDPNAALKNIPAEIIEKIQVFDQQSDQSQFTGFDDGNTSKTINIVTRLRIKQGTFGKLFGGYGDQAKFSTGGNINFFNDDQRISILTQLNNVNVQNFSSEDLLGVMSSAGQGGRRGMGGNMGTRGGGGSGGRGGGGGNPGFGSGQGGPGGGNASNFLVSQTAGLITTKALGLNYVDKWGESIEINGSYFFNLTDNNAESSTNRNYFLTSNTAQNYNLDNSSATKNINHRLNFRLNYQIDTSNSILFHPAFTAQLNKGASTNLANTNAGLNTLSSTTSLFNTNLTALNSTNELLYRHKFDLPGRTISLDFNGSYNKNSGDNKLFAEDLYYNSSISSDTLNEISDLLKQGFSASSGLVYTEPFTEYGLLQFNSKYSYSEDKSNKSTYDIMANSSPLDTGLSNIYKKYYTTQSYGTGYWFRKDNLSFSLGVNYNISQLRNEQTYPFSSGMEKSFYSILPSFMLQYRISKDQNLRIFYRTNNDDPSIDQLQEVLNNSNPTQLTTGNPNLSQDYKHSFNLRYMETGLRRCILFSYYLEQRLRRIISATAL
jgi:Outer membrane protein beta-barrel family/CarboxypepD_reg-like domain